MATERRKLMAQEERKAKAVLAAAIAWRTAFASEERKPGVLAAGIHAADKKLAEAIEEYEAVKAAKSAEPPADPGGFHCPNCGTDRPPYGWHFNIGDTGPFALQWITCFCGDCKEILGVSVVQFMPKQELVEMLKQQFAGKVGLV